MPATLPIGTVVESGETAHLTAPRFNRHTFWCGQSGSGKTYALGVVLEQLLAHTQLPIVIFDPNADFVRLGEVRPEAANTSTGVALASRDIRVLRPGERDDSLRVRFSALPFAVKAAVLRLDPLEDRAEYNSLLHLQDRYPVIDEQSIVLRLRESPDPSHRALAERVENLSLDDWGVWAGERASASEIIAERPDATVLDLGGFRYAEEALVVALSVLDDLWTRREERRPVLLVIDEAHNLCSPDLETPLGRAVRDQIIRIAAEGRKYGLWLLLSTQRPSKVHPGIISQCDNLALMKMSSPIDLAELGSLFGFVPASMVERAPLFGQGTAIFAGGFIGEPKVVQLGQRVTYEGGIDVGVPLREPSA
jgi:DNA helicase HerA-like ATPase